MYLSGNYHPIFFAVVLPVALFFSFTAWSPPLFYESLPEWWSSWQKSVFAPICHQQLSRSFHISGVPLAVCSRCTGIYTFLLLSLIFFSNFPFFVKRNEGYFLRLLLLTLFVVAVDGAGNFIKWWHTPDLARFITGAAAGAMTGLMLMGSLLTLSPQKITRR